MTPDPRVGDDRGRDEVRRTLLLLPSLVGLAGVATTVVAGIVSGLTDGSRGWLFTAIAAGLVLTTVLSGGSYGLYAGLAVLAIGALVADGGPTLAELMGLVSALVVVHKVVRFSLDARRPSRFGPGLITGYVTTTVATAALAAGGAAAAWALIDRAPTGGLWIPVGVAVAALPLFARDGADLIERRPGLDRPIVRGTLAVAAAALVASIVVIGSQARTEIGSDAPPGPSVVTTTTTAAPETEAKPDEGEGVVLPRWAVALALVLVGVFVYLMLRRPEAIFELEQVEQPAESTSLDLAMTGLADADDEVIEVDDQSLARMLRDLQLDISAERDPGRAIRFGYAKIEHELSEVSLVRTDVETEREFLLRALPALGQAGDSMTALTRLFERARFGHEPVDEAMRQRALTAIDDLLGVVTAGGDPIDRPSPDGRREGR